MHLWSLLFACSGAPDTEGPAATGSSAETDTTGEASATETDTAGEAEVEGVEARLLEDVESVVVVEWEQLVEAAAWLEFREAGEKDWRTSRARTLGPGTVSDVVLDVPYDTEVSYRVVVDHPDEGEQRSAIGTITTGERPETLPEAVILANEVGDWDEPYLITSMNRVGDSRYGYWWVFIMRRDGTVVWAKETEWEWVSRHVSPSSDGASLFVDRDTAWRKWDAGAASTVVRMTLDGEVHATYATPGLHHAFMPLPDDSVTWLGKELGDTSNELLYRVDTDGETTTLWNCGTWFTEVEEDGTCGSNALWWDPRTDHFLISLWSKDTVIEVDHATGQVVRWFGQINSPWRFDPEESTFWWQHGALYTDDNTLLVSSKDQELGDETVVREYTLDEETQTLTEVWNFGEDRGIYGPYMGEAHRLPNGNTLHIYGAGGHMAEADADGDVVWEATWKGDQHNGRTTAWTDLYDLAH